MFVVIKAVTLLSHLELPNGLGQIHDPVVAHVELRQGHDGAELVRNGRDSILVGREGGDHPPPAESRRKPFYQVVVELELVEVFEAGEGVGDVDDLVVRYVQLL